MAQLFNIVDDTVVIDKLSLKYTQGSLVHSGFLQVTGNVQIDSNLVIRGTVTADTFAVENLITSNGSLASVGQWAYNTEDELNGKGFSWTHGAASTQLVYRTGNRLWSNANIDIANGNSYSIDNIPVLTADSLGAGIVKSNLTTIGTLEELAVSGSANLGEFVFVDSITNRLGIGTDEPNASLTILDNNVEIGIGSPDVGLASIGTYSSHDLSLITDNIPRITIKNNGEVQIGRESNNNSTFRVYGTIYAKEIIADTSVLDNLIQTKEDSVIINKLSLKYTQGSVIHAGSLAVVGSVTLQDGLGVAGGVTADTITVNTLNVKNLNTGNGSDNLDLGNWTTSTESELIGKGLNWTYSSGGTQLIYSGTNTLTTNAIVNSAGYEVNGQLVLTDSELGTNILRSNLNKVGTLESLSVLGSTNLGGFAKFEDNKFIITNNVVDITTGISDGVASIGTTSEHDFSIKSNNLNQITLTKEGEVQVGDSAKGNGVLRVYGAIYADSIETDNRIDRAHPLEFQATPDTNIYGLGLVWTGTGVSRQLIMRSGPDRLWSSESFDLGPNQSYYIDGKVAITNNGLGDTIINSSLQSVGTLTSLSVSGDTTLASVSAADVAVTSLNVAGLNLTSSGIASDSSITIDVAENKVLSSDTDSIELGDKNNTNKTVKVFGPLSVNINNPDPTVEFSVNGNVSLGGKKFISGLTAPTSGQYQIGDICWNTQPQATSYVGWICVVSGTPGQWLPFGAIAAQ
jgi:hypothetical protein